MNLRFVKLGAGVGAALGFLFATLVISFADCAGPHCTGEAVIGLLGHAVGGGVLGALLAGCVLALRRIFGGPH